MFVRRRSGKYRVKARVIPSTSGEPDAKSASRSSVTMSSFIYTPHAPSSPSSASSASASASASAVIVQSKRYLNTSPPTVSACHVTTDSGRRRSTRTTRGEACPLRPDDHVTRAAEGGSRQIDGESMCSSRLRNQQYGITCPTSRQPGDDRDNSACRWETHDDDVRHQEPLASAVRQAPATDARNSRQQPRLLITGSLSSSSSSSSRLGTSLPSPIKKPLTTCYPQRTLTRASQVTNSLTTDWSVASLRMTSCHDSCSCHSSNCHRVGHLHPRHSCTTSSRRPIANNCGLTTSGDDGRKADEAGTTCSIGTSMTMFGGSRHSKRVDSTSECSPATSADNAAVKVTYAPSPILMTSFVSDKCEPDDENDKENCWERQQLNETSSHDYFVSDDRMALVRTSTARCSLTTLFECDEHREPLPDISVIDGNDVDRDLKTSPCPPDDLVTRLPKMRRSDGRTRLQQQQPVTIATKPMAPIQKSNGDSMQNKMGQINLSVYINSGHLTVHVVQCRQLALDDSLANGTAVQVSLIPREDRNNVCRTGIILNSEQPNYDEKFSFELTGADLQRRLLVSVWQVGEDPALDRLVGATSFGINNIASNKTIVEGWYWLLDDVISKVKHQMATPMQFLQQTLKQMHTYTFVMEKDKRATTCVGYGLTLSGGTPSTVCRIVLGGPAHRAGLRTGDVISQVNGHSVMSASTDSVARIIRHSSRGVVMQIQRHVTPPIDAHQLRMIALAYAVSDDVTSTCSDDDEDDEDRSSLYDGSLPALRYHHDNERRQSMCRHYR